MKHLLLLIIVLCAAPLVRAQQLPVPGSKNPDWALEKAEARPNTELADVMLGTDRMPNAMQKSVKSTGNRHYHWDGNRQLAYEWLSRPNSRSVAPDKLVMVRAEPTGTVYTYRRRSH